MRIVNKDKQSRSEDKQVSARLIRRTPLDDSHLRSNPKRNDQNACPVCGERIEKTAAGGRRKHSCVHCGATLNKELVCDSCGTHRIWRGKKGAACRGCGAKYSHNSHQ
jgi:predicted RNA-binding Zn-ribbon protein involved in translation (DUF1610 family)